MMLEKYLQMSVIMYSFNELQCDLARVSGERCSAEKVA